MPSLEALLASGIEVVAVVTNPDRPAGRGLRARPSPVKEAATRRELEVLEFARARDPALDAALRALGPDAAVVVAYGSILPAGLLKLPRLGFVNLHFSLLPRYRGAAPVQRALMDGVTETGVSVMVLTEGMDEGPVLAAQAVPVGYDDDAATLGARLASVGASLLVRTLTGYAAGALKPEPQDDSLATYAPKLSTEEARIDWTQPTRRIRDLIRACVPEPGAWTIVRGARLKVFSAEPAASAGLAPGELATRGDLVVGTGDGALALGEVQVAGRRRMGAEEVARGLRLGPGEVLGEE